MHLVCPLAFFPTSPLRIRSFPTRQAAVLAHFGLFTILSKQKPRLAPHHNVSKKTYRRVHHSPQTYHSCDQTTLQTKRVRTTCEGTTDRPLSSASVVLRENNRCRIFHNGVRWREDSLKRSGELPSVRNEGLVRGKKRKNSSSTSTDSNVNVNLESA